MIYDFKVVLHVNEHSSLGIEVLVFLVILWLYEDQFSIVIRSIILVFELCLGIGSQSVYL